MATSYVMRDRTGRQLDRITANSREEAIKLYKAKKANVPSKTATEEPSLFNRVIEAATHEYLPEKKFNTGLGSIVDKPLDFAYEYGVRPMSSPLGIATSVAAPLRVGGTVARAVGRGLSTPVSAAVRTGGKANVLARIIDEGKSLALTSGFPGTNLSFHGVSLAATNAMAHPLKEGGLIKGAAKSARLLLDQKYAAKEAARLAAKPAVMQTGQAVTHTVRDAVTGRIKRVNSTIADVAKRAGVTLESHQQAGAPQFEPFLTKGKYNPLRLIRNVQEEVFDKPLFGEMVPAMKLEHFERVLKGLEKATPPKNKTAYVDLAKEAAEVTNNFYGGLGKASKWNKGAGRYTLLAPDWYERHMNMGKAITKAIANPRDPKGQAYRTFTGNMATTMGLMSVANKAMSGHHIWENQAGKNFQIDTGKLDDHGRRIYIDPTAGSLDFARLPIEVLHSVFVDKSIAAPFQIVQNRLNTVNRTLLDIIGANYKPAAWRYQFQKREKLPDGSYRWKQGPDLPEQIGRVAEDILDNMGPGWAQALEDLAHKGERDPVVSKPQAYAKAFEIPLKFVKDKRPEIETRGEAKERARDLSKKRKEAKRQKAIEAVRKRSGGS